MFEAVRIPFPLCPDVCAGRGGRGRGWGARRDWPPTRSVTKRGQAIHLTRKEFDILHCLMSRAGRVVTYARLLTAVWGADCREEVEYLRTFVRQLRKKIEDDPARPVYLLTDIYVGYRFADAEMLEESQNPANGTSGDYAARETRPGPENSVIGHA